jgi:hypothetical protein
VAPLERDDRGLGLRAEDPVGDQQRLRLGRGRVEPFLQVADAGAAGTGLCRSQQALDVAVAVRALELEDDRRPPDRAEPGVEQRVGERPARRARKQGARPFGGVGSRWGVGPSRTPRLLGGRLGYALAGRGCAIGIVPASGRPARLGRRCRRRSGGDEDRWGDREPGKVGTGRRDPQT